MSNRFSESIKIKFIKGGVLSREHYKFLMLLMGFPDSSVGKESACHAGDLGSIPGLGRSPGERKGYSLQCSGLENSKDYSPWDHKESDTTERLSLSAIGQIYPPQTLVFVYTVPLLLSE